MSMSRECSKNWMLHVFRTMCLILDIWSIYIAIAIAAAVTMTIGIALGHALPISSSRTRIKDQKNEKLERKIKG